MNFTDKDTAQRCKTTNKVVSMIRQGCWCGCVPDKGLVIIDENNIKEYSQYKGKTNEERQPFFNKYWQDLTLEQFNMLNYDEIKFSN